MKILCGLFLCLVFVLNSSGSPLTGKTSHPEISGTVTGSNHKFAARARVKLFNAETGKRFQTKTNKSGFFRFKNLPFGTYRIEITSKEEYLPKPEENLYFGLNGSIVYNASLIPK